MSNSIALVKFSPEDESLLKELARDRKQDLSVVSRMTPQEVLADVDRCVSTSVKIDMIQAPVVVRIGALLARIERDELFTLKGYKDLTSYYEAELQNKGFAFSTLSQAKRIFGAFPDLSIERYAKIGPKMLEKAARACNPETSAAQKATLLEKAEESPSVERFTKFLEEGSGLSYKGKHTAAMFELFGNKDEVEQLKTWLADERFIEFAKSKIPINMILSAIEESSSVWPVHSDEERRLFGKHKPSEF